MEVLLTPTATAECSRCHLGLTQFNPGYGPFEWLHTESLKEYCADAPMARPISDTIKQVSES